MTLQSVSLLRFENNWNEKCEVTFSTLSHCQSAMHKQLLFLNCIKNIALYFATLTMYAASKQACMCFTYIFLTFVAHCFSSRVENSLLNVNSTVFTLRLTIQLPTGLLLVINMPKRLKRIHFNWFQRLTFQKMLQILLVTLQLLSSAPTKTATPILVFKQFFKYSNLFSVCCSVAFSRCPLFFSHGPIWIRINFPDHHGWINWCFQELFPGKQHHVSAILPKGIHLWITFWFTIQGHNITYSLRSWMIFVLLVQ